MHAIILATIATYNGTTAQLFSLLCKTQTEFTDASVHVVKGTEV